MGSANFISGADALADWRDDLLSGTPPVFYPLGTGELAKIQCAPGQVLLIGGAPGAGKTAFVMQAVADALRRMPDLRAVVCNIEMPPAVLLERQLARLSGVDLTTIRNRQLTAKHADRIDQGLHTLATVAERLCFVAPPYDLGNVAATVDHFGGDLLILDYIQRIAPPGQHADKRGSVDATMNHLRQFAAAGQAVIVVSAVGRTKDAKGRSSYTGEALNLASFRESSELEFGADDAYILHTLGDDAECIRLKHLKSRYGELCDIDLIFDRPHQRFTPQGFKGASGDKTAKAKMSDAISSMWNKTAPADAGADDE